jgi:hypothetical protein
MCANQGLFITPSRTLLKSASAFARERRNTVRKFRGHRPYGYVEISGTARRWIGFAVLLFFAGGMLLSASLALSSWLAASAQLDPAIALQPWSASLRLKQAHPAGLAAATALAPRRSQAWIALALHQELNGDPAAERSLLKAAEVDRSYAPCWALANYYARAGRSGDFWRWAQRGVALYEGDLTALYRLALAVDPNLSAIWRSLAPRRPAAQRQFLNLSLALADYPAAAIAGVALAGHRQARDGPLLAGLCDRAIESRSLQTAITVWNAMVQSGLLPYRPLDPPSGEVLTNGDFRYAPIGAGFDWRILSGDGFTIRPIGKGISIVLQGTQPDPVPLLRQVLPVITGAAYEFSVRLSGDLPPDSLHWRINGQAIEPGRPFPVTGDLAVLELIAARAKGYVRPRGRAILHQVSLNPRRQTDR